jgi:hypothetical protein
MESFEEYLFKLYEELKLLNEILSKRATTHSLKLCMLDYYHMEN